VLANVWALHDPRPHGVPVAGLSPGPGYTAVAVDDPRAAVRRREVYAARGEDGRLYFAGANGQTVNRELVRGEAVTDVVPLAAGDPNGMSLAQVVLGTILGGFLTGVLMAQLALGAPLWQRWLGYLAFGAGFGLLLAVVTSALAVLPPGSFLLTWAWCGATAATISVTVGALARMLGQPGIPLAMLAVLIVGNPSAGAQAPAEYLPWLFRTVGPYLPPNALASGLTGTTYFEASVLRPVLVLVLWAGLAALALSVLDRTRGSRRALAYDAASAADEREDRRTTG
jgi:hypothetical protein